MIIYRRYTIIQTELHHRNSHSLQIVHQSSESQETSYPHRQPCIDFAQWCRPLKDLRASGEICAGGVDDAAAGVDNAASGGCCDGMAGE